MLLPMTMIFFKLTPEDDLLETLCVTKISPEERQSVERRTLGQDKTLFGMRSG